MTSSGPLPWALHLLTDRRVAGGWERLEAVLRLLVRGLPPGRWLLQFREKDLPGGEALRWVRRLQGIVAPAGIPVVVNDRLDVAIAARVQGLHVGEGGLDPLRVRGLWPGLLGVSRHSVENLRALPPGSVDYAYFSPIFETPSKKGYGMPQGLEGLRSAVAASSVPVVALGGIDGSRVAEIRRAGAQGVAAIRAVWLADDPPRAARDLLDPFL